MIKKGMAVAVDVPIPECGAGEILVQVYASSLSVGTELAGLQGSAVPLWKRALAQPDKVRNAIQMGKDHGLSRVVDTFREKSQQEQPTGYSAAGIVVQVGQGVGDIRVGDKVACAGAQYAHHAEFIRVARNLCAKIPEPLDWSAASTVTLGAIALQGVRRAEPTLGETFVVIGLGILGQLTAQLLRANGCTVIGTDLSAERVEMAQQLGMAEGLVSTQDDARSIAQLTNGYGADGVIITASSPSDQIISTAFGMCRKKGRVVLVGDVGLHLQRGDFYVKEIDFLISTSYGPGRYDQKYEEHGLDYPIGYVRWTENRNMKAYLRLLSEGRIRIEPLIGGIFPIHEAAAAYEAINGPNRPLLVVLSYPHSDGLQAPFSDRRIFLKKKESQKSGLINLAVIGAGGFARSTHLPNIQTLRSHFTLRAIVNRTGPSAKAAGQRFGADYVTTSVEEVMADPQVDAVCIATRHSSHGSLVLEALEAGKHVFVEKPLTLNREELTKIKQWVNSREEREGPESLPIIMTGYNRRFSPYFQSLRKLVEKSNTPFLINYRVNAGYIPADHWVHSKEGGGRNLGEACHFYDFFVGLAQQPVSTISAHCLQPDSEYYLKNDNFVATLSFSDGSVANLVYSSMGHSGVPKEIAELYSNGKIAFLNDYKSLRVHGEKALSFKTGIQQKGHLEELKEFANGIRTRTWPIPLWQQLEVAEVAFSIEQMISE